MRLAGPSIAEERGAALRARIRDAERDRLITSAERHVLDARFGSSWRTNGAVLSAVFFLLTCLAVTAFSLLCEELSLPRGIVAGVVAIVLGEMLIAKRRFFGTGVESALWISGLVCFITALPSSGKPEAILVFVAAFAIAGARVRSPWLGAIAAILVVVYAAVKFDDAWPPLLVAGAVAVVAAIALGREWQRPSTEQLFQLVAIAAPVAGYVAALAEGVGPRHLPVAALYVVLAAGLGLAAIARRDRVLLAAASLSLAIALVEGLIWTAWRVEAQLVAGGVLALTTAAIATRMLRARRDGFVLESSARSQYEEALQIVGAMHVGRASAPGPESPHVESGGGSFGGAGASGEF